MREQPSFIHLHMYSYVQTQMALFVAVDLTVVENFLRTKLHI